MAAAERRHGDEVLGEVEGERFSVVLFSQSKTNGISFLEVILVFCHVCFCWMFFAFSKAMKKQASCMVCFLCVTFL